MPALQDGAGSAETTSKRDRAEHLTALLRMLLASAQKSCVSWVAINRFCCSKSSCSALS